MTRKINPALHQRRRRPEYRNAPAATLPNTRRIALDFLTHLGWLDNPALYVLLRTGWTEEALGRRVGALVGAAEFEKHPQATVSRDVSRPLSIPHRRVLAYMHALSAHLQETKCTT